jgi:NAD(P)-dependent dehydrogenase (short-subunit alcohol dehydrogenase family)
MASAYDVRDRVVFITGAARGIGLEAAQQLVAKGAKVALVGLEPDELARRAAQLGEAHAVWFEADVTDLDTLRAAADGTVERFGGIDVAIANAGIAAATPLIDGDVDAFDTIVRVNLGGVYRTLQATLPHVTARSGYVLPIASLAAAIHAPMMGAYNATKAGVEALANSLRPESRRRAPRSAARTSASSTPTWSARGSRRRPARPPPSAWARSAPRTRSPSPRPAGSSSAASSGAHARSTRRATSRPC